MTLFDRHIIFRFLSGIVLLLLALIVFFIVLHYVEYIDDFIDRGAKTREVFLVYYPNYIPEIVRLTSPLAVFLSCIYLTSKLTQQLQLMAMQTTGVSLYRLLWPYLLVGIMMTGFMFWFNGWVVPKTNRVVVEFEDQYFKDKGQKLDTHNIHRQTQPGSIVTVRFFDAKSQVANGVSLQQFDNARRLVRRLDAYRMTWVDSLSVWRLEGVVERAFHDDGTETMHQRPRQDTTLHVYPRDFSRTERDVESMTIPAAEAYLASLERTGVSNLGRSRVAFHAKFSYPFANLILVLMGVPLAAVRRRGGQAIQIGLGLLTAFVYLALIKIAEPFGYAGTVDPQLVAWLPHAIFLFAALVILLRARK